eukprot:1186455-Prorocentrum_minimum.AAC.3
MIAPLPSLRVSTSQVCGLVPGRVALLPRGDDETANSPKRSLACFRPAEGDSGCRGARNI